MEEIGDEGPFATDERGNFLQYISQCLNTRSSFPGDPLNFRRRRLTSGALRLSSEAPFLSAALLFRAVVPTLRNPVFGASAVGGAAKPGNQFNIVQFKSRNVATSRIVFYGLLDSCRICSEQGLHLSVMELARGREIRLVA